MEQTFAACLELGRSLGFDEAHSVQDARLALRLFDVTSELHGLGDEWRDLLYCAGLLHDIGYSAGYVAHHKTSFGLILEAALPGLTDAERRIVASVARYHRGARPCLAHAHFAALDAQTRDVVTSLSAILRLADGLDRTHTGAVSDLEVRLDGDRLVVLVRCPLGCEPELFAGEKKGRFFGELFGIRVEVREYLPG